MRILRTLGALSAIFLPIAFAVSALAADGAALYAKNCVSCHGADGKSDTPAGKAMKAPAIAGHDASATVSAVRENAKHKTPSGKLSDDELQSVADYLKTL